MTDLKLIIILHVNELNIPIKSKRLKSEAQLNIAYKRYNRNTKTEIP